MDQVICEECKKPIKKRKDLCVALYAPLGFSIRSYHNVCYVNQLLALQVFYRGFHLINTRRFNYGVIFCSGGVIFLLFLLVMSIFYDVGLNEFGAILGILGSSIFPILRLYSYTKYEKHLT